jgi:hypothetical protein
MERKRYLPCEVINETVIIAVRNVVQILHANDIRDFLRFNELLRRHITQIEMKDESLMLKFGEYGQRLLD